MTVFEVRIEVPPSCLGEIEAQLLEKEMVSWTLHEDVVGKSACLIGCFADGDLAQSSETDLRGVMGAAGVPSLPCSVVREAPDTEWKYSYRSHFKPWRFGPLHWVPVWGREGFVQSPGEKVLWLDPGMAFGTGNHETTRLVAERLVSWVGANAAVCRPGSSARVIDVGCGSGILALSAARLGVNHVSGFDLDPEAVRVSRENAAANGLTEAVDFYESDIAAGLADRRADLLLANIQSDVLQAQGDALVRAIEPGGMLVLSGILLSERERVAAFFEELVPGWYRESKALGEWCDLVLVSP